MELTRFGGLSDFKKDSLIASLIFTFHTTANFLLSYPHVRTDTVLVFLQPIRALLEHGTFVRATSSNFYTGNPFFAIPFFEIVGYTPLNFKIFMSLMMGLATVAFYFFYKKAFGRRKAVCLTLILFTFNSWLTFRYMDWTYILFFEAVILYLYTVWMQNQGRELYLLAFVSGLSFYFKTIMLYLMAGLSISTLEEKGRYFILDLDRKEIIVAGVFFIAGLSPFLIYSYHVGFDYLTSFKASTSLIQIINDRIKNIAVLSWPGIIKYDLTAGIKPLYHIYTPLIVSGYLLSLREKINRRYALIFTTILLLSLNVVYRVSYRQIVILIPLMPIFLYANLDLLSLDETQKSYIAASLAVVIILLSFHSIEHTLSGASDEAWEIDPYDYELKDKLDVDGPIAVNYYDIYLRSSFDMDLNPIYFMTRNYNETDKLNPILSKQSRPFDKIPENTTYILVEDGVCEIQKECSTPKDKYMECRANGCGPPTSYIKKELSLEKQNSRHITAGNHNYSVYNR